MFAFAKRGKLVTTRDQIAQTVIPLGMVGRVLVQLESALQIAPCLSVLGKYTMLRESKLIVNF